MKLLNTIALLLVVIGAINWGLWGFFQFDIVAFIGGGSTTGPSRLVYSLVGLAGVWSIRHLKCGMSCCKPKGKGGSCCK